MATTFKAIVKEQRKDKSFNVKIRITHNRENLRVPTNLFATPDDLTRDRSKFKNQSIIDTTDDLIRKWRGYINALGKGADYMTVKEIVDYINNMERAEYQKENNVFKLDFLEYGRKVAASKSEGTGRNYYNAISALERFLNGKHLDINDITAKFLQEFEEFINNEPVQHYSRTRGLIKSNVSKKDGRAVSQYLACVRHIFNKAKEEFNDEDVNLINIPRSPFQKYKLKKIPRRKRRAIKTDLIQQIINLPDLDNGNYSLIGLCRRNMARDLFLLSFGLAGMNAADIYDCPAEAFDSNNNVIRYYRKKTRTRREDMAEMQIRVEPCLLPLLEKYKDPDGVRLFCFHKHFYAQVSFNNSLKEGIKKIINVLQCEKFTFYSARHSWATIGRSNEVNIDKYTIHEGLNHVDDDMRTTDIYAQRDYRNIWEANKKIISLFDWSPIHEREKNPTDYSIKKKEPVKKHTISAQTLQQIINLPDFDNGNYSITGFPRRDLARDLYILSFGLAGMGANEIYNCPAQSFEGNENIIIYYRTNQATRESVEVRIRVEPYLLSLIEKYKDPDGKQLFRFYKTYDSAQCFAAAINQGIDRIVKALQCEKFTFYTARNTWESLDQTIKIKEKKRLMRGGLKDPDEYRILWEANEILLSMFDWSPIYKKDNSILKYSDISKAV